MCAYLFIKRGLFLATIITMTQRFAAPRFPSRFFSLASIFTASFLLTLFLGISFASISTIASPCSFYTSREAPDGYAPPVNVYTGELMVNVDCKGDAAIIIGKRDQNDIPHNDIAVHTTVYAYKPGNNSWDPYPVLPVPPKNAEQSVKETWTSSNVIDSNYFKGYAETVGDVPYISDPTYVIAYFCHDADPKGPRDWKCGCSDTSCANRNWVIQAFRDPKKAEAAGSGDQISRCDDNGCYLCNKKGGGCTCTSGACLSGQPSIAGSSSGGGNSGGSSGSGGSGGPSITLEANPSVLPKNGGSTTITWSSPTASACTASGAWNGDMGLSGSRTMTVTTTSTFTLTCTDTSGASNIQSATVWVGDPPPSSFNFVNQPGGPSWLSGTGQIYMPDGHQSWKAWMGHDVDIMTVWPAMPENWEELESGKGSDATYLNNAMKILPKTTPIVISYAMIPNSFSNAKCKNTGVWDRFAQGEFDNRYVKLGQNLKKIAAQYGRDPKYFVIRLGWEMNGDWYPWSVCNKTNEFKQSWARATRILRQEIPGVVIDFSPNHGSGGNNPMIASILPPIDTFDVISMSHHDGLPFVQDESSWNLHLNGASDRDGLQPILNLAVEKGKKFALTEWGTSMEKCDSTWVKTPKPEFFIRKTYEFLSANRAHIAWDTHFSPGCTSLYTHQSTEAAKTYKELWK